MDPTILPGEGPLQFAPQDILSPDYEWDEEELMKITDNHPYIREPPLYSSQKWEDSDQDTEEGWNSGTVFMRSRNMAHHKQKQSRQRKQKPHSKYDDMLQMEMASIDATVIKVQVHKEAVDNIDEDI